MKRYRSHRIVEASPIYAVKRAETVTESDVVETHGGNVIVPHDFFARGQPAPGDYLVRYQPDGYLSWSPKAVFEAGYTVEPENIEGDITQRTS